MGARAGFCLKFLQWFVRGVQFCCAGLVLAIYSYFLATLHNHGLEIATWIRAVEGISGVATLYTACGLALLCCVAGYPLTSFIAIVFDVAFVGGFIYIAQANRGGAGSCTGEVHTPFGSGDAETTVVDNGHGGFTSLPKLGQACQLETACLAVSIVAIFFFIFSIFVEVQLARYRSKEKRFGPSPANDYTSGYGHSEKTGLFGWLSRHGTRKHRNTDNALPEHTTPDQLNDQNPALGGVTNGENRTSYATETTAVGENPWAGSGHSPSYPNKYGEPGEYGHHTMNNGSRTNLGYGGRGYTALNQYGQQQGHNQQTSGGYRYEDGVYERA